MQLGFFSIRKGFDIPGYPIGVLQVNNNILKSVFLKELSGNELKVLLCIASHVNEEGFCFLTQSYLAKMLGFSPNTVSKAIRKLLKLEIDGYPIFKRKEDYPTLGSKKYSFNFWDDGSIKAIRYTINHSY